MNARLAQRLERAEALSNAACVEARRALAPARGAEWIDIAGAYAMFDGPDSPLTQTFGIGLFDAFLDAEFARVESFFASHGAATAHEVCSFASPETLALLGERGYSPIEASVVLVRDVSRPPASDSGPITVRAIDPSEADEWSRVAAEGWSAEMPQLREFLEAMGAVVARARGATCFLAEKDGEPIASAALNVHGGVALLAGAATVPRARKQGAQRALLRARLEFAAAAGADVAMIVTQPGSASQRNAERQGFRAVYTRAKWQRG